jgi:hypothetical protein
VAFRSLQQKVLTGARLEAGGLGKSRSVGAKAPA